MASVDGVYVGPLQPADAATLIDDIRAGRDVLPDRQLARRRTADPGASASGGGDSQANGGGA